tara:strand:+ start:169 stop:819 length:651 start_codon:yes stop_codon:yes gene_type:complete
MCEKIIIANDMTLCYKGDVKFFKDRISSKVRNHNKDYKLTIMTKFDCFMDYDSFDFYIPMYEELVVGYVKYKDSIIPFTEAQSVNTILKILTEDNQFKFAGESDDIEYQKLFAFLTSISFLKPKNDMGEDVMEVVSIFDIKQTNYTKYHLEMCVTLTSIMTNQYTDTTNIDLTRLKIIDTSLPRKKITLASTSKCVKKKELFNQLYSDCPSERGLM